MTTFGITGLRVCSRRLARRLADTGWVLFGLGNVAMFGALAAQVLVPTGLFLGAIVVYVLPLFLIASALTERPRARRAASVAVDGGCLVVGDERLGPFAEGRLRSGGALLVDTRGREIEVDLPELRAAELLTALGLDAARRRFTYRWSSRGEQFGAWALTFVIAMVAFWAAAFAVSFLDAPVSALLCAGIALPAGVAELASRAWGTRELAVGAEGIAARSRLGRRVLRFVDVGSVGAEGGALVFTMKDGTVHRVLADETPGPADPSMLARVRDALAAARTGASADLLTLLDRAGRSVAEWQKDVARVLTAAAGFRDARIDAGELVQVLDDATAPLEQRVAAAMALGSDPLHRPRVRVAAAAVASPRLRVALEALAEGELDEAAVEQALKEAQ